MQGLHTLYGQESTAPVEEMSSLAGGESAQAQQPPVPPRRRPLSTCCSWHPVDQLTPPVRLKVLPLLSVEGATLLHVALASFVWCMAVAPPDRPPRFLPQPASRREKWIGRACFSGHWPLTAAAAIASTSRCVYSCIRPMPTQRPPRPNAPSAA